MMVVPISTKTSSRGYIFHKFFVSMCIYLLLIIPVQPAPYSEKITTTGDRKGAIQLDKLLSATEVAYGSAMIVYGRHAPSQLQAVTVMRVAGYPRLEEAMQEFRRNVRQTIKSMIYHSPSLLQLRKSMQGLRDQADMSRRIMAETRVAKADGILTAKEEKEIYKLQKKQLRMIRRDMKRIRRGSSALARIWDTLDLDEVWEIAEDFLFMAAAVLATGNSNLGIGYLFAKWCYLVNLGMFLTETNSKLDYPIARFLIRRTPLSPITADEEIDDDFLDMFKVSSFIVNYGIAAYIMLFHHQLGIRLNRAMISAMITLRGLSSFLQNKEVGLEETSATTSASQSLKFSSRLGALGLLILAVFALIFGRMVDKGNLPLPSYLNCLVWIENLMGKLISVADIF